MKKSWLLTIAVAVVVIGVAVYYFTKSDSYDKPMATHTSNTGSTSYKAIDACKLFTLAEAKDVLGQNTTAGSNTSPTNTDDINVSTCSYTNNASAVADIRTATVTVRSALTRTGAESNRSVFGKGTPANAQKVDGLDAEAYFLPDTHSLNILDGYNWILIISGGTQPNTLTVDNATTVAHKVLHNM
jgi:hypothetical protein